MKFREIGKTGLRVSQIGLGCNSIGTRVDRATGRSIFLSALDEGINFFDTADVYGASEEQLGQVLGGRRHDVVIATKFGLQLGDDSRQSGGSRRWVFAAAEGSLRRLGTDYIDLFQFHRPDPAIPIDETLEALGDLVTQGKVRHVGCSNISIEELDEALAVANADDLPRFASVQNELSLLRPGARSAIIPRCRSGAVAFLPYFPLASGLLTGKYAAGRHPPAGSRLATWGEAGIKVLAGEVMVRIGQLEAFARAQDRSLLELAFAWLLAEPAVASVIAGASRPEQLRANVAATGWRLDAEQVAEIDRLIGLRADSVG